MKLGLQILFFCLYIGSSFSFSIPKSDGNEGASLVFSELDESIKAINTMAFTLTNYERIDDQLLKGIQKVVMTTKPFRCHVTMIEPGDGEELVFAGEKYNNNAIYEPNGFPYIQLELNPNGALMRKNNHHTIFDLGYATMMEMLKFHMNQSEYTLDLSEFEIDGRVVLKLSIDFINFSIVDQMLTETESLNSLAKRLKLNDYMLSELNSIDISDDLKKGSKINLPSSYAKKIELHIDADSGLLVSQIVYDEKGVYEKYEFSDVQVNIVIPENRFDSEMLGKAM